VHNKEPIPLHEIPDGFLGKLVVYKSGKVMLDMGGVLFDVNIGTTLSFHQEAALIDHNEGKFVVLGNVQKKLLVTPNLDNIL
jgi:DNA-directed RNA polymerase III subunit RPC4